MHLVQCLDGLQLNQKHILDQQVGGVNAQPITRPDRSFSLSLSAGIRVHLLTSAF
jgi:hypothetical protein